MTSFFARPWRPPKSTPPPSAPRQGSASGSNDHSRPDYPWFVPHLKVDEPMRLPTGPAMWRRPTAMNMTGPLLPRYGHSVPLVSTPSGDIYVFGGRVKGEVKDDLWMIRGVWEPDAAVGQDGRRSTKEMSVVASLVETTGDAPGPRVGHKSALVSTALIVWGGHTLPKEGERHDDGLYLLNLTTHEWIKVGVTGPAPLGRWGHAVGVCGNKFIVFGGRVDGEFFNDLWGFDLRSLVRGRVTWEQLTPDPGNELPPPRTGHVLVTYKNEIYIFGGTDGACHYNDTWCFNISTRTWSELTCIGSIPIPREGHAATLVGDVMYIFGGRAFNGRGLGDMASFKISNKRWYILQNMGPQPSERSGHATAVADGRMFVIGGEGDEWSPTLHDVMTLHVFDTSKPTLSFLAPNQPCADLIKYPERKRHQREKSNAATSPPLQQPPAPQPGLAPSGEGQSSSSTDLQEEARKRKNATTRKAQEAIARKEHEKTLAQKAQGEAAGKLQERTQSRTHEEPARGAQEETQRQEDPSRTPDGEWTKLSPASDEESAYESASEERGMSDARENESAIPDITTLGLSEMTTPQMLRCLVDYGCIDLTSAINPEKTSLGMVVGGSFGDIWSGQLRDNTSIAIKVWRFTSLTQDRGKSLKRAMREICYWSELNHPHIHKLLGVTVFQGRLGMVSEWMANGNLREYIQKNPSTKRHPLCVQVTSGVEYLHHRGTVHGDIKACNFLVSQDRVVKLTDFDHSIMMDCSIRFTETSRVGGGTLRWMAPELVIIEPTHQRNKRTDVYALGMTLLEVITGRVPYELECQSDTTVVMKLLNKVMPRRTEHFKANRWGNGMWNLLVRCWDHDPNIRPSAEDANVLVLDLSPPA